jgi:hypothetical protein
MRIRGVETNARNAIRHDAPLIWPHHIFEQERKPSFNNDVTRLKLVEAADVLYKLDLIVDGVGQQQYLVIAHRAV